HLHSLPTRRSSDLNHLLRTERQDTIIQLKTPSKRALHLKALKSNPSGGDRRTWWMPTQRHTEVRCMCTICTSHLMKRVTVITTIPSVRENSCFTEKRSTS